MGLAEKKNDPKICKGTKFEPFRTFLASLRPVFAFGLLNKLPLQMGLVVIGPHKAEHNPKLCKQSK